MDHLTDSIIRAAINEQLALLGQRNVDSFDTHDVIRWLIEHRPVPYVEQLYAYIGSHPDGPFYQCHMQIGQSINRLSDLVVQNGHVYSLNIHGVHSRIMSWRRTP